MALALAVLNSARVYLNDINALTWSDAILMPYLQEAYGELIQELDINQVGVIKTQSQPILVPAGALNLGSDQPTNILEPIMMLERDPGTDAESFVDMYLVKFLPLVDQSAYLTWWAWLGEVIQFVGATSPREVILRYKGYPPTPQLLTDPIGVIFGDRYLGPRVAALAKESIDRPAKRENSIAEMNLHQLIQRNVLAEQIPVRRRAYRSPKSTLGITGPVATTVSTGSGGNGLNFISTSTPPDGIRTGFVFPYIPRYVSWNGMAQFPGKIPGYVLTVVAGQYTVTFKDTTGATLTPGLNDIIEEYY